MVRLNVTGRKVLPERRKYGSKIYVYSKSLLSIPPKYYIEVSDGRHFSLFLDREFAPFAKKPYIVIPRGNDEFFVVVPKFVDFQIGWLFTQNDSFNVFVVNRFVRWLSPIPDELRGEIRIPDPVEAYVEGDELWFPDPSDYGRIWRTYRSHLSRKLGEDRIKIKRGHAFELITAMINDGILPFTPQPVNEEDIQPPAGKAKNLSLRPYQRRAWKEFLEKGAVGIYWPPSAGKTFIGLYALSRIRGKKLVVVPTRTLVEQWERRIQEYTSLPSSDYQVITYHSFHKVAGKKYSLVIYDEHQHLPANSFAKLSTIDTKYRIGMTATPFREDGRTDLIFALSGTPVGVDWSELREKNVIEDPEVTVVKTKNLTQKIRMLKELLDWDKKTLIFCDSIALGERVSRLLNVPFVHGKTSNRLSSLQNSKVAIVSRVGDEGLSLGDLEVVIELDFLFGSRRQQLQRVGRLLHSNFRGEHYVLMTESEFERYQKRFMSLYEKGIKFAVRNAQAP